MPAPTAARSKPGGPSPFSAAAPTSPTRPRTGRSGGGSRRAASSSPSCRREPAPGAGRFPARNRVDGRAGRDDGRGRGGGALRLVDHGRPRRAISAATWAPYPGRSTRGSRRGRTRCSPAAPAWSADAQDVLDAMLGPGVGRVERAGPAARAGGGRGPGGGGERRRDLRQRSPRRSTLTGAEAATALAGLEAAATSSALRSAPTPGRCCHRPVSRVFRMNDSRPRQFSRSPALTPAAAPGSRPTSRPSRAAGCTE